MRRFLLRRLPLLAVLLVGIVLGFGGPSLTVAAASGCTKGTITTASRCTRVPSTTTATHPATSARSARKATSALALSFVPNAGQTISAVRYTSHTSGGNLYFAQNDVILTLSNFTPLPKGRAALTGDVTQTLKDAAKTAAPASLLQTHFNGTSRAARLSSTQRTHGRVNYTRGLDPSQWHTNLPVYGGVQYTNLYPGVTLRYEGASGQPESIYTIAAGANPALINWSYTGITAKSLDAKGDLVLTVAAPNGFNASLSHTVVETAPFAYQMLGSKQVPVSVRYVLRADGSVGFALGSYNKRYALIIDPTITYGTYVGGSGMDQVTGVSADANGDSFIVGFTTSDDLTTTNGAFQTARVGGVDTFITRLGTSSNTVDLLYSTYLGGTGWSLGQAIAVDGSDDAAVVGLTTSDDFPTSDGAFQTSATQTGAPGSVRAFVTSLDSTGAFNFSTYLTGSVDANGLFQNSFATAVATDSTNNIYVTGYTSESDFPIKPANAFQTVKGRGFDAYATKFDITGALQYSTFIGGNGTDYGTGIAVDAADNAYVVGWGESTDLPTTAGVFQPAQSGGGVDGFLASLASDATAVNYLTYVGLDNDNAVYGVAVDAETPPNAYVVGSTDAVSGSYGEEFDASFDYTGVANYIYSLGSATQTAGTSIAASATGEVFITGFTSGAFDAGTFQPITGQDTYKGGAHDAFVYDINGGADNYLTYLGGSGDDVALSIAIDPFNDTFVGGYTTSTDLPITANGSAYHNDLEGFLFEIGNAVIQ